jgi:hypothetical protein
MATGSVFDAFVDVRCQNRSHFAVELQFDDQRRGGIIGSKRFDTGKQHREQKKT